MADEHQEYVHKIAVDHTEWLRGILLKQLDITINLCREEFLHGYKHGWEDRTREEEQVELPIGD